MVCKMNERIKDLLPNPFAVDYQYKDGPLDLYTEKEMLRFAELIVRECTQLLFEESERLYTYSSECDNMRNSDEAELCAEKCMDNIAMIEKHFGNEE